METSVCDQERSDQSSLKLYAKKSLSFGSTIANFVQYNITMDYPDDFGETRKSR